MTHTTVLPLPSPTNLEVACSLYHEAQAVWGRSLPVVWFLSSSACYSCFSNIASDIHIVLCFCFFGTFHIQGGEVRGTSMISGSKVGWALGLVRLKWIELIIVNAWRKADTWWILTRHNWISKTYPALHSQVAEQTVANFLSNKNTLYTPTLSGHYTMVIILNGYSIHNIWGEHITYSTRYMTVRALTYKVHTCRLPLALYIHKFYIILLYIQGSGK